MRRSIAASILVAFALVSNLQGQRGQAPCDAQPPKTPAELIAVARCWDARHEFGEAVRGISSAIAAIEAQPPSAPDEIIGGPVFVGGTVAMPSLTNKVSGEYPAKAAEKGIAGTVIVEVTLKSDGGVNSAKVVDSIPELDAAALSTVKKMKFARTLIGGKPAEVTFYVPARFGLQDEVGPDDWMVLAQSYVTHNHPAAAVQTLGKALQLERSDVERFGPSLRRVGEGPPGPGRITEPTRTKNVPPKYPTHALNTRAQGRVIIEALIDLKGRVGRASVLRSAPGFDAEALNAVRQWTYSPTLVDGKPVSVVLVVTVTFSIH